MVGETAELKSNRKDEIRLKDSLRPLRVLTYYGGILTDWNCEEKQCRPSVSIWINYLAIGMVVLLLISVSVFELAQLLIEIFVNLASIRQMIWNCVWFCTFPTILFTQYNYLRHRKAISEFLDEWSDLEVQLPSWCRYKRFHRFLYVGYLILAFASVVTVGLQVYYYPTASFLISHYQPIRDALTLPVTGAIHLIALIIGWVLISVNDIVPTFIFSHIGCAIWTLSEELNESFECIQVKPCKFSECIRRIWCRFERLCNLLEKTNQLFGSMIVFAHGYCVFMISTLLYLILSDLGASAQQQDKLTFLANMICSSARLAVCTILASKVDRFSSHLQSTLTELLSRNWDCIPKADREIVTVFLNRLQCDKVAACPMGLYYLTLSFLLNVSGLIISYVIILLQSK